MKPTASRRACATVCFFASICLSIAAVADSLTQESIFGNCLVNSTRCPDRLSVCNSPEDPGEVCEYCTNPAISMECESGFGICIQSTYDSSSDCGEKVTGICGPAGCDGAPMPGERCPRYSCYEVLGP